MTKKAMKGGDAAKTADFAPQESAGYLVRDAHRAFQRLIEKRIAPFGVTRGQWYFLRVLWTKDGVSQRELSESVGMMEPTTVIALQSMEKAGGVPTVAEILNLADRSTEKSIMEGLESEDPDLVEQIRRLMFVFEDIKLVDDKGIQTIMKEVDNDELALALKTASPELQEKIFKNMSERAAQLIKEDMQFMGPVRVSDVEAAQQRVVDIVRRLEDSGDIIISGRGGESEMLV